MEIYDSNYGQSVDEVCCNRNPSATILQALHSEPLDVYPQSKSLKSLALTVSLEISYTKARLGSTGFEKTGRNVKISWVLGSRIFYLAMSQLISAAASPQKSRVNENPE